MTENTTPAAPFEVGAEVKHKAVEDVIGVVEETKPGVADGTFIARVAWPEGAPVELTGNEWHGASNLEHAYPTCDNCGNRHPQVDPAEALELVKLAIVAEAMNIAQAEPGKHPRLEQALMMGAALSREVQIRNFASALDEGLPEGFAEEGQ